MIDKYLNFTGSKFKIIVEVVPPSGTDFEILSTKLDVLKSLPIDGFSVASNPLAKAKMDSLISSFLVQNYMKKPTIFHCTTRDQNRIGLQAKLWGAKALNINTVVAMTGDSFSLDSKDYISAKRVREVDVLSLVAISRNSGLYSGIVIGNFDANSKTIKYFKNKVEAGAQFAITQPVYSLKDVARIKRITAENNIPIIMGLMPIRSIQHAEFISKKLEGIFIPQDILKRISLAKNQMNEGIIIASEMLDIAYKYFEGVCIMPPLTMDGFNMLPKILEQTNFYS